jgi:uncharacterized protein YlxW (UPF0749 family)
MRNAFGESSASGWTGPRRSRADLGARFQVGRGTLALTLCAVLLGALLVAQLQTELPRPAESDTRTGLAATTIERLEREAAELKKSIKESRERIAVLGRQASTGAAHFAELSQELERQKVLAGVVPLRGRGISVVLDDTTATRIPADADPGNYIVHEYQLRDVLNLLWQSGAEAVALNGERIVATTSIYCVGSTILVNDTRLSPPYEFLVIGDPAALESALNSPANLKAIRARVKSYGIQLAIARQASVTVPAFTGSFDAKHVISPTGDADRAIAIGH